MKSGNLLMIVTLIALSGPAVAGNVIQTAQFPGLAPETLYNAFLSAKDHAGMTGYPAMFYRPATKAEVPVSAEGDEWHAFGVTGKDGKLQYLIGGRFLRLVPGKEIVTTWRAAGWADVQHPQGPDLESILVLTFKKTSAGAEIQLVQVDVPDDVSVDPATSEATSETSHVNTNWYYRYWEPMHKYFAVPPPKSGP
jgi:uncharacterized protein YndB with AHSA1/START domain